MVKRVLIVKTSSMGDVLHTLPALTDANNFIPDIKFDWVVEENFAQIPSWHFAVDQVIPVAIRRWRKAWFTRDIRAERQQFYEQLNQNTYDVVIDAQGLIKSAFLITRKANGIKHGLDRKSAREPIASWFYDVKHAVAKNLHAVERVRLLFAQSLGYQLTNDRGDYAIAQHFVNNLPLDNQQYLVFLHSTTRHDKHWTEEQWRNLIKLVAADGYKIKLPWGSEPEYQRSLRLAEGFSNVEVLPKLTIAEVANVLAGARVVVSVDTGLSHLTAALDRPNVTLYGPTDPKLIGGYGQNQYCIISHDQQMKTISADDIYNKIKALII